MFKNDLLDYKNKTMVVKATNAHQTEPRRDDDLIRVYKTIKDVFFVIDQTRKAFYFSLRLC